MIRRLALNTVVSAGAFVVTTAIMLALVPLLIREYGLAIYGLIMLARVFLPFSTFALFDFGYSEFATQAVARARVDGDWRAARRQLYAVTKIAAVVALVVGPLLALLSPWLVSALHTPAEAAADFQWAMIATAATFVPLLMGLVADGIVKGFESFRALRAIDVISSATFGAGVVACVMLDLGFLWVVLIYNASLLLRLLCLLTFAWRRLPRVDSIGKVQPEEWASIRQRCHVMAMNKWLGVGQAGLAPLLVGLLLGPASAALLDIIMRIPRFAKVALGVLNTAVLPVAARLEASGQSLRRLGEVGLVAVGGASIPTCVGGMTFSAAILGLWIAPEYSAYGFWQALMFLVPMIIAIIGFGGTMLLVRPEVTSAMNKVFLLQIIIQYGIAVATFRALGERAFILGQVVAVVGTFLIQVPILARAKQMPLRSYGRLLPIIAVPVLLSAICWLVGLSTHIDTIFRLVCAFTAWLIVNYALLWFLALRQEERAQIMAFLPWRATRSPP